MWYTDYSSCPPDSPLKNEKVSPGKGIVGCEMHEINGWGSQYHLETITENNVTLSVIFYDANE